MPPQRQAARRGSSALGRGRSRHRLRTSRIRAAGGVGNLATESDQAQNCYRGYGCSLQTHAYGGFRPPSANQGAVVVKVLALTPAALASFLALFITSCSYEPSLHCGEGTHEVGDECVPLTEREGSHAGMRFFVTSSGYTGDLMAAGRAADGLAGADALCQTAATGADLGGTWKAFISSSDQSAIDRIADVGPWFDLKGRKVFNNKANLATTPLGNLMFDENGREGSREVWTGSNPGGLSSEHTCNDWTGDRGDSSTAYGTVGSPTRVGDWLRRPMAPESKCTSSLRLYCFEQ